MIALGYQFESIIFVFCSPATQNRRLGDWMTGRVALGNARWAVPKTDGRVSMEKVALGVAGLPTDPLRATVAELWLKHFKNTRRDYTRQTGPLDAKHQFLQ